MTVDATFTCATCDVTITHHPVFHLGLAFCCAGCAADGPCMCSYDNEQPAPAVAARAEAPAPVAPERAAAAAPVGLPARRSPVPVGAVPVAGAARH